MGVGTAQSGSCSRQYRLDGAKRKDGRVENRREQLSFTIASCCREQRRCLCVHHSICGRGQSWGHELRTILAHVGGLRILHWLVLRQRLYAGPVLRERRLLER